MYLVNKRTHPYDVYIGRGSIWGNPYSHLKATKAKYKVGSRQETIECYRLWLWEEIKSGRITKQMLIELDGKVLGCYCVPKSCHGEVILRAIQWAKCKEV